MIYFRAQDIAQIHEELNRKGVEFFGITQQ
jgi:hypothetical protein